LGWEKRRWRIERFGVNNTFWRPAHRARMSSHSRTSRESFGIGWSV
jgi:hypothetical protein